MISLRILSKAENAQTASLRRVTEWLPDVSNYSLRTAERNMRAPSFEPEKWNDNGAVQLLNNCYNYALDIRTDNRAQPGGRPLDTTRPIPCIEVSDRATKEDLLRECLDRQCHPSEHLVALAVLRPKMGTPSDAHWFRRDADGTWSHKRGDWPAARLVTPDIPRPIDPIAWLPETYKLCGYFCVYKPEVWPRIEGHEGDHKGSSLKQDLVSNETRMAQESTIETTLDLYSMRPNPTWTLAQQQLRELQQLFEMYANERRDSSAKPSTLGYAGFVIRNPSGSMGLPYMLKVYSGVLTAVERLGVKKEGQKGEECIYYADACALEEWLLEQAAQLGYAEAIERMGGPRI